MSEHHVRLRWKRTSRDFKYETYNRAYEVLFKDGRIVLPGSSAPGYRGDPERVDPEEAFVASLSGCHMLTFLAICARKGLVIEAYEDDAVGRLEKEAQGKLWMANVTLRPRVQFAAGTEMNDAQLQSLHHRAHEECFIANSVKTVVTVEAEGKC